MTTLNPEFKAKWLVALRSGDYPQGRNHLRSEQGFCCLGVAADLLIKENSEKYGKWLNTDPHGQPYDTGTCSGFFQHTSCMDGAAYRPAVMTNLMNSDIGLNDNQLGRFYPHPTVMNVTDGTQEKIDKYLKFLRSSIEKHGFDPAQFPGGIFQSDLASQGSLAALNDSGVPFAVIADIIEEYF